MGPNVYLVPRMKPRFIAILAVCVSVLFTHCGKKSENAIPVAQVGDAILTLEDVMASIPPEYSAMVTQQQYRDYVRRWVENEILFQEALHQKFHQLPGISRQIHKARRDILVAQAIQHLCPAVSDISEFRIQQYYEKHQEEFIRHQYEIKSLHIRVPEKKQARDVQRQINPHNFIQLARRHSVDPVDDPEKVPFVSAADMLPEIARFAFKTRPGGTTNPIHTPRGYYIVRVLEKEPPRTLRSLAEVREQIVNRLTAEKQKNQVEALVEKLKLKIPVATYLERLPSRKDSAAALESTEHSHSIP